MKRTIDNIKDPLYRCFEREINYASKLLNNVIQDLKDVVLICQGEKKQTNYHRLILNDLVRGILPEHWRRYTVPKGCTVIQWITDFRNRIIQFQKISEMVSTSGANELQVLISEFKYLLTFLSIFKFKVKICNLPCNFESKFFDKYLKFLSKVGALNVFFLNRNIKFGLAVL